MENQEVESPAAWRPEPGKTAWTIKLSGVIEEVMINSYKHTQAGYKVTYTAHGPITGVVINKDGILNFFPTAEAALASIKVYDLNGVEVPRSQPVIPVHVQGYCKGCGAKMEYEGETLPALHNLVNAAYNMDLPDNDRATLADHGITYNDERKDEVGC